MRSVRTMSAVAVVVLATLALTSAALPRPIPENPQEAGTVRTFMGSRTFPKPVQMPPVPQHPFMAPNGRSNIHYDAYQTDTLRACRAARTRDRDALDVPGRGVRIGRHSTARTGIVAICVGFEGPRLCMFDPQHARGAREDPASAAQRRRRRRPASGLLGRRLLLPRQPRPRGDRRPTTATSGSWARPSGPLGPGVRARARLRPQPRGAARRRDHLRAARLVRPALVRVGARGRRDGRPGTGAVQSVDLAEPIAQLVRRRRDRRSLHRHRPRAVPLRRGTRRHARRDAGSEAYDNIGVRKPGQTQPGSGTTPTLMSSRLRRDHRQRRPDEDRRLPARGRWRPGTGSSASSRSSARARARPTSR